MQIKAMFGVVGLLVVLMTVGAAAQDKATCDMDKVAAALDEQVKLAQAAAGKADGESFGTALHEIGVMAGAAAAECAGLKFDSKVAGMQPVLGPITFEDGIYKATVTTTGFFMAEMEILEGTCDAGFLGLFNLSSGEADAGAQNLLKTQGCQVFLKIGNTSKPWTLSFEKIK